MKKKSKADALFRQLKKAKLKSKTLNFVEIGSFTGAYSKMMAAEYPNATIFSIEACPRNFKTLVARTKKIDRIIPIHMAISTTPGKVKFYVCDHPEYSKMKYSKFPRASSQSNSLYKSFLSGKGWTKKLRAVMVDSMSLDDFCKDRKIEHIDFLKINCEGCEYDMFDGSLDFLKHTTAISLQMHGKSVEFRSTAFVKRRKKIVSDIVGAGFKSVDKIASNFWKLKSNHVGTFWVNPDARSKRSS